MELLIVIIVPVLGSVIASFLTVLVVRKDRSSVQLTARSACDHCGHDLAWYELIPLVSFVIQKGKCRYCGKSLDVRILLGELLGLLFFGILAFGSWQLLIGRAVLGDALESGPPFGQVLGLFLVHFSILTPLFYLALYDLFWMAIPQRVAGYLTLWVVVLNIGALLARLLGLSALAWLQLGMIDNLIMGIIFGGGIYALVKLTNEKGIGQGDIFIAVLIGLALGWPETVSAFYVMLFSATVVGLIVALIHKKFKGLKVPLVPFMTLGYIVAVFYGEQIFKTLFFAL